MFDDFERSNEREAQSALLTEGTRKFGEVQCTKKQEIVLQGVLAERERQIKKFGVQVHNPEMWLAILMEEVGELAQAILHDRFGGKAKGTATAELVQVCAVALAMLESDQV